MLFNAFKRLIAINHIQNKSLYIHNIRVCIVFIYFVCINTNTFMYTFKKNFVCILNVFICNTNVNVKKRYTECLCIYIYTHSK